MTGLPQRNSSQPWSTRATAFALARQDDRWLMLRHRRLDVVRWELPGGHVEAGETLEQTARRETLEETGVDVEIGQLLATCVHEWAERRQRRLIAFFAASARDLHLLPGPQESEPEVLGAHWRNPVELKRSDVSAFLHPLIDARDTLGGGTPLHYRAEHQRGTRRTRRSRRSRPPLRPTPWRGEQCFDYSPVIALRRLPTPGARQSRLMRG